MKLFAVLLSPFLLLAACGSPDSQDDVEFTFTPVAYKQYEPLGRPVYVNEKCQAFTADEVGVAVSDEHKSEVVSFLRAAEFELYHSYETIWGWQIELRVPVGSVPDALTFISANENVIRAEPNGLGSAGETLFGCKEAP
jgi:hypothetical protein